MGVIGLFYFFPRFDIYFDNRRRFRGQLIWDNVLGFLGMLKDSLIFPCSVSNHTMVSNAYGYLNCLPIPYL